MSAPGCHIFLWYASLICQAVCIEHTGVRRLISLFTRLEFFDSADKAVWMHMMFSNRKWVSVSIVKAKFGEHCDTDRKGLRQMIRQHRAMIQESAMLYMTSAHDSVLVLAVYLHVRDQDSVRQIWDGHDKCLLSTMEANMLPCAADLTTDHDTVILQCECSRNFPK